MQHKVAAQVERDANNQEQAINVLMVVLLKKKKNAKLRLLCTQH